MGREHKWRGHTRSRGLSLRRLAHLFVQPDLRSGTLKRTRRTQLHSDNHVVCDPRPQAETTDLWLAQRSTVSVHPEVTPSMTNICAWGELTNSMPNAGTGNVWTLPGMAGKQFPRVMLACDACLCAMRFVSGQASVMHSQGPAENACNPPTPTPSPPRPILPITPVRPVDSSSFCIYINR